MQKIIVIGIDPSATHGAIAVLDSFGSVIDVSNMPPTPLDIFKHLKEIKDRTDIEQDILVCYLEDVGHGRPNQSTSATAKFARHCGHLDMALVATGIKTVTVLPSKWEKTFQLGSSKGYSKTEWKNKLKQKAQQLFPQEKITLANCDALLIAEYGRQKEK